MTDATVTTIIIALIAAIPGVMAAVATFKRSKTDIDATQATIADTIQDAALELLAPYKEEVSKLRAHIKQLEATVEDLQTRLDKLTLDLKQVREERNNIIHGAYVLYHQVKSANITPGYTPPEYRG